MTGLGFEPRTYGLKVTPELVSLRFAEVVLTLKSGR
jgi:hypothetical protein